MLGKMGNNFYYLTNSARRKKSEALKKKENNFYYLTFFQSIYFAINKPTIVNKVPTVPIQVIFSPRKINAKIIVTIGIK